MRPPLLQLLLLLLLLLFRLILLLLQKDLAVQCLLVVLLVLPRHFRFNMVFVPLACDPIYYPSITAVAASTASGTAHGVSVCLFRVFHP